MYGLADHHVWHYFVGIKCNCRITNRYSSGLLSISGFEVVVSLDRVGPAA
jgi:hypothetical protein